MFSLKSAHTISEEELVELNNLFTPALGDLNLESLRVLVPQLKFDPLIYNAAGELMGLVFILDHQADYQSKNFLFFKEKYESFYYLDRVAIHKKFQGQGLGKALYRFFFDKLLEHGERLTLEVNLKPRNDQSLAFHKGLGFQEVGAGVVSGKEVQYFSYSKNS